MAERKVVVFANRRLQRRYALGPETRSTIKFRWPAPNGQDFTATVRDVSLSGLSMGVPDDLVELAVGDILKGIEVRINGKVVHGDLLAMHVTRVEGVGSICGGLFYPQADEDLITIRLIVRALEAES